jgi:hypothetical protein
LRAAQSVIVTDTREVYPLEFENLFNNNFLTILKSPSDSILNSGYGSKRKCRSGLLLTV